MYFPVGFALMASLVAVFMDLSLGKVRNWWICILWTAGMIYQMLVGGWWGVGYFMAGSLFPIAVLYPLFRFRMLGPGDIKLFSALGGVMGVGAVGTCMAISFLCGGVLSLVMLLFYGNFCSRLRYFTDYIHNSIRSKKIMPYYVAGNGVENIHFTVPVLMGVVLYAGGLY